jgi:hypothetical protein
MLSKTSYFFKVQELNDLIIKITPDYKAKEK